MSNYLRYIIYILLLTVTVTVLNDCESLHPPVVSIIGDQAPGGPVHYGIRQLTEALSRKHIRFEKVSDPKEARGRLLIIAGLSNGDDTAAKLLNEGNRTLPETSEVFTIFKSVIDRKPAWVIGGYDDRGTLYGLLEVAERIGWCADPGNPMSEVKEVTEKPDVSERAISVFTMNRAYWESRFYDEAYWNRYFDMLVKNRFNSFLVIFGYENGGFLAPCYPYFFNVEGFPGVRMVGITPEEQQKNLDALLRLIKISHEHGIRFSVGIWDHIYRGGVQGGGIPGKESVPDKPEDGLVWGLTGENLIPYTRTALEKFLRMVPGLDGIQFRMHNESGLKKGEQVSFWSDVFRMMKKTDPDLRLDLRAKELPEAVIDSAIGSGIKFRITTKYWMEQMGMPYHPTKTNPDPSPIRQSYAYLLRYPKKYDILWRLWNGGTSRVLLWGDPEYVRRFARSTHLYDGDGFEVNEPLATKMEAQPHNEKPFSLLNPEYRYYTYEFERYWHFFQVFGRIGYNPDTDPEIWDREFTQRFGNAAGPVLEKAIHEASWILPRIITSSYPYSLFPMTRGWAEKQHLGTLPEFAHAELSDREQFAGFDEEATIRLEGGESAKILPSENSAWFEKTARDLDTLITRAETMEENKTDKEFISTIADLKILSGLARYHSRRILAAVSYRMFERSRDVSMLDEATGHERDAVEAWKKIVAGAGNVYSDDPKFGVCNAGLCGSWKAELASLEKGLSDLEKERDLLHREKDIPVHENYRLKAVYINYDSLFHVSLEPLDSFPVGRPMTVKVNVSSLTGIKWVKLRYRSVNQDLEYQTMAMKPANKKDLYEATVPASAIDPVFDFMYYIEIMDTEGRGRIYPELEKETPYRIVRLIR